MSIPIHSHAASAIPFTSFFHTSETSSSAAVEDVVVKAAGLGDLPMDLSTMPPSSGSSASAFFPSFDNLLNQLDSFDRQQPAPQPASQPVVDTPQETQQEITLPVIDQPQNTETVNAPATNNDQVVSAPVVSFPAATEQAPIPASAIVSGEVNMPAASVVVSTPAPAPVAAPVSAPAPVPAPVSAPAPAPPSNQPVTIALDSPAPATPATVQAAPANIPVTNPVDAPTPPPPAPKVEETPAPSTEKSKETAQETRPPLSKPAPPPSTSRIGFGNPTNYMDTPEKSSAGGGVLSANDSKSSTGGLSAYAYAGIVLAGVVAGVILLVFARKVNRRRRDRDVQHEQDAAVFEQAKAAYSSSNEPSREEMMTMTAIMQEATPKPEKIGSQRTSLMAWAKGGRKKKKTERFEDLVSTFEPETTTTNLYAQPHVSTIYEDVDSEEDEDEEALRNVIVDHNRQGGATISAKLTAMMSNKSAPKYAGTVNRRYSDVPVLQPGQMSTMMGQTAPPVSKKRQSMQQPQSTSGYNVINLSNSKLPKLAPVKEYTSANALEEMVNENRTRIQKANAGGTFANFAARPTSMFNTLESMTSPTPKHRWSLANTLEDAADRMVKTYSTDSSPALSIKMPIAKHSIAISKKFDAHQSQESLVSSIDIPPAVTAHSSNHSLTAALRAQASRISLPDTVDSSSEGRTSLGSHSSKRVHTSMNAMQAAVGGKIPSNTLVAPPLTYAPSEAGDSVSHGSDGYLDFDIHRMRRAESPSSNGNHLWSNRNGLVE